MCRKGGDLVFQSSFRGFLLKELDIVACDLKKDVIAFNPLLEDFS